MYAIEHIQQEKLICNRIERTDKLPGYVFPKKLEDNIVIKADNL